MRKDCLVQNIFELKNLAQSEGVEIMGEPSKTEYPQLVIVTTYMGRKALIHKHSFPVDVTDSHLLKNIQM